MIRYLVISIILVGAGLVLWPIALWCGGAIKKMLNKGTEVVEKASEEDKQ